MITAERETISQRAIEEAKRVLAVALTSRGITIESVMIRDMAIEIQKGYNKCPLINN